MRQTRKWLSIILCLVMVLGLVPASASAEGEFTVTGAYMGHTEADATAFTDSYINGMGAVAVDMPVYFVGEQVYVRLQTNSSNPVTWAIMITNLDDKGLTLDANTGVITGTVAKDSIGRSTIRATDTVTGETVSFHLGYRFFSESSKPVIDDVTLPDGQVGASYGTVVTYSGYKSAGDAHWTLSSGSLPAGLTMRDYSNGDLWLSGSPEAAGTYSFGVKVTTSAGTSLEKILSLLVRADAASLTPEITNAGSLPYAVVGRAYEYQFTATGAAPIKWEKSGTWPEWLKLDEATGRMYGTPDGNQSNVTLSVRATHTDGVTYEDTESFWFNIVKEPAVAAKYGSYSGGYTEITGGVLPEAKVNEYYLGIDGSVVFDELNNSSDVTISTAGTLPAGMEWQAIGRAVVLDGTPTETGTFYFRVTIDSYFGSEKTDLIGSASREFSLTVSEDAPPVHIHTWSNEWTKDETHHWHECTASGCDITENSEKNGYGVHVYDDDADTTCNTCGYERTITPPVHTCEPELVAKVEPTHFAEGKKAYYHCDCGKNYEDSEGTVEIADITTWGIIPVTDHELSGWKHDETGHWKECTIGGCTHKAEEGAHVYDDDADTTCNVCGYVRTITPPVHTCEPKIVAKVEPTHFTEGKEAYYTCTCGKYYEDAAGTVEIADITTWGIIPVTDHVMSDWKHDETGHWKECTIEGCTHKAEEGDHVYDDDADTTCNTCGYERTVTPPHTHDFGTEWKHDDANHWHECACGEKSDVTPHTPGADATEDTPQTCTVCGYVLKTALGHVCANNLTLTEKKEATHFEEGKEAYYTCTCGKYYEDAAGTVEIADIAAWGIIPKTDHVASEWISDENNHWHECTIEGCDAKTEPEAHRFGWVIDREATKTEAGSKHEECSVCGYKKATVEIPAAGSEAGQDTPKTGDNGMMLMWTLLLFVSLGGAAGVTVLKRKGLASK